jgi:hypothetical protein
MFSKIPYVRILFVSTLFISVISLLYPLYHGATSRSSNGLSIETRIQKNMLLGGALASGISDLYHSERSSDRIKERRFTVQTQDGQNSRKEWSVHVYEVDSSGWREVTERGYACIEKETKQWLIRPDDMTFYVESCPK